MASSGWSANEGRPARDTDVLAVFSRVKIIHTYIHTFIIWVECEYVTPHTYAVCMYGCHILVWLYPQAYAARPSVSRLSLMANEIIKSGHNSMHKSTNTDNSICWQLICNPTYIIHIIYVCMDVGVCMYVNEFMPNWTIEIFDDLCKSFDCFVATSNTRWIYLH